MLFNDSFITLLPSQMTLTQWSLFMFVLKDVESWRVTFILFLTGTNNWSDSSLNFHFQGGSTNRHG